MVKTKLLSLDLHSNIVNLHKINKYEKKANTGYLVILVTFWILVFKQPLYLAYFLKLLINFKLID